MSRSLRTILRLVANVFPLLILCSIAALLFLNLQDTKGIRGELRNTENRIKEHLEETQVAVDALSRRVNDLSQIMQNEIASARKSAGGDVSRMGSRLSGRLAAIAERMELVTEVSRSLGSVQEKLDAMSGGLEWTSPASGSTKAPDGASLHEMDAGLHALELEADALFNKGRYGEASAKFALILERQPANNDIRVKRAVSMFRANPSDTFGYSAIERQLKSVLEAQGEIPVALEVLALLSTERREWSEASGYFRRLLAIAPCNGSYLKEAGECSLYGGNLDAAKAYIEEALRLFPQDDEVIALARRLRDSSTGALHRESGGSP